MVGGDEIGISNADCRVDSGERNGKIGRRRFDHFHCIFGALYAFDEKERDVRAVCLEEGSVM